jgi:hypothetical protein
LLAPPGHLGHLIGKENGLIDCWIGKAFGLPISVIGKLLRAYHQRSDIVSHLTAYRFLTDLLVKFGTFLPSSLQTWGVLITAATSVREHRRVFHNSATLSQLNGLVIRLETSGTGQSSSYVAILVWLQKDGA